jgi:uncharacterized membrane protein
VGRAIDVSAFSNFEEVNNRFDEIIKDVRNKDTSLERSLDLLDEAIALGTRAVELVDRTDFSPAEKERMVEFEQEEVAGAAAEGEDVPAASGEDVATAAAEKSGEVAPAAAGVANHAAEAAESAGDPAGFSADAQEA